jgi:hypothetical protein
MDTSTDIFCVSTNQPRQTGLPTCWIGSCIVGCNSNNGDWHSLCVSRDWGTYHHRLRQLPCTPQTWNGTYMAMLLHNYNCTPHCPRDRLVMFSFVRSAESFTLLLLLRGLLQNCTCYILIVLSILNIWLHNSMELSPWEARICLATRDIPSTLQNSFTRAHH